MTDRELWQQYLGIASLDPVRAVELRSRIELGDPSPVWAAAHLDSAIEARNGRMFDEVLVHTAAVLGVPADRVDAVVLATAHVLSSLAEDGLGRPIDPAALADAVEACVRADGVETCTRVSVLEWAVEGLWLLGERQTDRQQKAEAIASFERAAQLAESLGSQKTAPTLRGRIATIALEQGRRDDALAMFDRAIAHFGTIATPVRGAYLVNANLRAKRARVHAEIAHEAGRPDLVAAHLDLAIAALRSKSESANPMPRSAQSLAELRDKLVGDVVVLPETDPSLDVDPLSAREILAMPRALVSPRVRAAMVIVAARDDAHRGAALDVVQLELAGMELWWLGSKRLAAIAYELDARARSANGDGEGADRALRHARELEESK